MRLRLLLALACATLSGCTTTSLVTGAQPGPTTVSIADALGGGLVGQTGVDLGRDRRRALEAEYTALEHTPAGRPVPWRGDGRWSGEVIAAQPYRVGSQDCRQYTHRLVDGQQAREARGTACRNADGSWTPLT